MPARWLSRIVVAAALGRSGESGWPTLPPPQVTPLDQSATEPVPQGNPTQLLRQELKANLATLAVILVLWIGPLLVGVMIATLITAVPRPWPAPDTGNLDLARAHERRLQGLWECVSLERDGLPASEVEQAKLAPIFFDGNTAIFEERGATLRGTFQLDPTKNPQAFDLTVSGDNGATTYHAIYQLDHNIFRICFNCPAKERPQELTTSPGSGRSLYVYRRVVLESGDVLGQSFARPRSDVASAAQILD